MNFRFGLAVCSFLCFSWIWAQEPRVQRSLPVTRVVLYKNGVGYFEHLGRVRGNQNVTIPFTSAQLDDVLKSMTVLDLDGGRITGVTYGTATPVEKQLGDLRLSLGEKTTLLDFLGALRGTRLEIRTGAATLTGRLLSVESKTRISGNTSMEVDYVSIITEGGEVRTTEITPGISVRLLDRGIDGKVGRYLDLVSKPREADVRQMEVATAGTGERSLFVSYVSEAPVWKTTYRIVLNSKSKQGPLLQGWAIVDNTGGQDWENVSLSLVAGAPQSFIQNLSQPLYARRPVIPLPQSVNISPQTHESTLITGGARVAGTVTDPTGATVAGVRVRAYNSSGALIAETTTAGNGVYEFTSLPDGVLRLEFQASGFHNESITGVVASTANMSRQDARLSVGQTAESVEVAAAIPSVSFSTRTDNGSMRGGGIGAGTGGGFGGGAYKVDAARARVEAAVQAQELGDVFEYKLKEPITIKRNQSALVPIVQSPVTAEKVSLWNERSGLPRPERALWLDNTSGVTLDGGSFTVLEEETFAGEGIFEAIRPKEKRLISYAVDLPLNVSSNQSSEPQRVTRVRLFRGLLTQDSEVRESKTYTFRNEDAAARTVIVEHPVRSGYELRSEPKPAETTADWMRFRIQVQPKETSALVVEEVRPLVNTILVTNISDNQVGEFVHQGSIDKSVESALRKVLAQKAVVADLVSQKQARDTEMKAIFEDQQRLRENMKALKGSAEEKALLQRYTRQLDEQENRLDGLRKEAAQLEQRRDKAQQELTQMIQEMSFDVKL